MTPPPRVVTIVLADGDGGTAGALPVFDLDVPWWQEAGPVIETVRARHGLDITIARLLDATTFPGGPVTYLAECADLGDVPLSPWAGPLLADERRPSYAEVGGVAELIAWADGALAARGAERVGPVEQVRTWNLSCLLRVPTTLGQLWLKAVPNFFSHEAEVISALGSADPTLVPTVVASRPGSVLMHSAGERDGYGVGPDRFLAAVERFHLATGGLALEVLPSVPRLDPAAMVDALDDLRDRHGHDLGAEDRQRLDRLIDETPGRWRAAGDLQRLVHGDLHGGNLRLGGQAADDVVIDWGDAFVSHPLFDLASLDSYTPEWSDSALDRWLAAVGCTHDEWVAFRPVAAVRLAVLYRRFCDRIEPSELAYHRDDILPALRTGLAALE